MILFLCYLLHLCDTRLHYLFILLHLQLYHFTIVLKFVHQLATLLHANATLRWHTLIQGQIVLREYGRCALATNERRHAIKGVFIHIPEILMRIHSSLFVKSVCRVLGRVHSASLRHLVFQLLISSCRVVLIQHLRGLLLLLHLEGEHHFLLAHECLSSSSFGVHGTGGRILPLSADSPVHVLI